MCRNAVRGARCQTGWATHWRLVTERLRRERSMLRYTVRASLAEFLRALSLGQPFSPNFDDAIENAICLEAAMGSAREVNVSEVRRMESMTHVGHE